MKKMNLIMEDWRKFVNEEKDLQNEGFTDIVRSISQKLGISKPPTDPPMLSEFNSWATKYSVWLAKSQPLLKNSPELKQELDKLSNELKTFFPKFIAVAISIEQKTLKEEKEEWPRHYSIVLKDIEKLHDPYHKKWQNSYKVWLEEMVQWFRKYKIFLNENTNEIFSTLKKDPVFSTTTFEGKIGDVFIKYAGEITDNLVEKYNTVLSPEDQQTSKSLDNEYRASTNKRTGEESAQLDREIRRKAQAAYDAGAGERAAALQRQQQADYEERRSNLGDFARSGGSYSGNRYANQFKQREGKINQDSLKQMIKEQLRKLKK